jgi:hypothetical protein
MIYHFFLNNELEMEHNIVDEYDRITFVRQDLKQLYVVITKEDILAYLFINEDRTEVYKILDDNVSYHDIRGLYCARFKCNLTIDGLDNSDDNCWFR